MDRDPNWRHDACGFGGLWRTAVRAAINSLAARPATDGTTTSWTSHDLGGRGRFVGIVLEGPLGCNAALWRNCRLFERLIEKHPCAADIVLQGLLDSVPIKNQLRHLKHGLPEKRLVHFDSGFNPLARNPIHSRAYTSCLNEQRKLHQGSQKGSPSHITLE